MTQDYNPTNLGRTDNTFRGLDTFPAPKGLGVVTLNALEVTANCPVTGQPDFYTVEVQYMPDLVCVESKSVKLYFQQFREQGIFCEAFAVQIRNDFQAALQPNYIRVLVTQSPRGSIGIEALSEWELGEEIPPGAALLLEESR